MLCVWWQRRGNTSKAVAHQICIKGGRMFRSVLFMVALVAYADEASAAPTVQDAMNAVENHLASPVEIANQPAPDRRLDDEMQKNHVPGVSIAVVHNGKIQWVKAYGVMRPDGSPVTIDTLFQAASISKSVAA